MARDHSVVLLDRPELWVVALALLAVAVIGKWGGAFAAARYAGMTWHESGAIGALMNTRGLTELIVLNIGLQLGFVTPVLFTMLVLMAIATTLMAVPALAAINRRRPIAEAAHAARPVRDAPTGDPTL